MSKKIIIALLSAVILFVCVFTACNNNGSGDSGLIDEDEQTEEQIYIDDDKYPFVTDENGEKVLNDVGQFVVYSTNENGKIAKDENGEKITYSRPFEAYSDKDCIEEYGYKIALPKGWAGTPRNGLFKNKETGENLNVEILKDSYEDFYENYFARYEKAKEIEFDVTWEENLTFLGEACENVVRYTINSDDVSIMIYFFRNNGNLYKITYDVAGCETPKENSEAILKAITFKPFTYYEATTEEATKETTEAAE